MKKIVDEWIITAADIIKKFFIKNTITVNDIPRVQLSKLFSSIDESVKYN